MAFVELVTIMTLIKTKFYNIIIISFWKWLENRQCIFPSGNNTGDCVMSIHRTYIINEVSIINTLGIQYLTGWHTRNIITCLWTNIQANWFKKQIFMKWWRYNLAVMRISINLMANVATGRLSIYGAHLAKKWKFSGALTRGTARTSLATLGLHVYFLGSILCETIIYHLK